MHRRWNQRKIWTQNPPVWPPTKPPTDRHSTNFTKKHKSLKVSHLWSYRCQVSLFNLAERNWPIYLAKKLSSVLKIKILQKVLVNYAYSACLFAVVFHVTWRNPGELFIHEQIKLPCELMITNQKNNSLENIRDLKRAIGLLHDPVTWYKITHAGTQVAQWNFQNKGRTRWTGTSCFVLNWRPSMCDFVPSDRIVQRGYKQTKLSGFWYLKTKTT